LPAWLPVHAAGDISYRGQIAPIFAFHCAGCHGDGGRESGFDVRSYASLRKGGERGEEIVPGNPEASGIVRLIEGQRGVRHRMPLRSRPLTSEQIGQIKSWIRTGARDDAVSVPVQRLAVRGLKWSRGGVIRISSRIPSEAYLTLNLRASSGGRMLHQQGASVRQRPEEMNAGAPGAWIQWTLRRELDWPADVDVELEIRYASVDPIGARLVVKDETGRELGSREYR
jgi:mono/diheme cytochrome c family protein